MKPLTRLLIALTVLALLSSCSPSSDPDTSYAPASTPPSAGADTPPNGATSPTEPSPDADTQADTSNPDGSPASTAPADPFSQEVAFREERELLICDLWLAADETRSPLARGTFFYMDGSVRDTDKYAGTLILAADEADTRHVLRVRTPSDGDGSLQVEALAHTDENGAWRSGEHGSGCDAETAAEIIDILSYTDDGGSEFASYYIPISGMEFNQDSGVVLALCGYDTFLVYIEGTRPDAADYAEPIQLFYAFELAGFTGGQPQGFGIGLLAYNEGYGWSTLDG